MLDLSFHRRTDMLRHPIVVRDAPSIERRAGSHLNMVVGILFGAFMLWLTAFVIMSLG